MTSQSVLMILISVLLGTHGAPKTSLGWCPTTIPQSSFDNSAFAGKQCSYDGYLKLFLFKETGINWHTRYQTAQHRFLDRMFSQMFAPNTQLVQIRSIGARGCLILRLVLSTVKIA